MKVPVIGEVYDHFDDGKIRESRRCDVVITAVVPFAEASQEDKDWWEQDAQDADFLYAPRTDYLVYGVCCGDNEQVIYVRTQDGGWFSIGWSGGRLLDKSVWEEMKQNER